MHRPISRANRSGVALLEVLIAGVLLATAGITLLGLLGQTSRTLRSVTTTERSVDGASAELDRLVMLDRAAVLASVGRTTVRGWSVEITPVSAALFDVSVAESDTSPALVRTTIYRPDSIDASR